MSRWAVGVRLMTRRKRNQLPMLSSVSMTSLARLNTEIENLNKEVSKNEQALDSATALRKKQLAEINEEEKDMLQSITSMKGAVVALSKHHEAALLQKSKTNSENAVMEAAAIIQHQMQLKKHA